MIPAADRATCGPAERRVVERASAPGQYDSRNMMLMRGPAEAHLGTEWPGGHGRSTGDTPGRADQGVPDSQVSPAGSVPGCPPVATWPFGPQVRLRRPPHQHHVPRVVLTRADALSAGRSARPHVTRSSAGVTGAHLAAAGAAESVGHHLGEPDGAACLALRGHRSLVASPLMSADRVLTASSRASNSHTASTLGRRRQHRFAWR